MHHVANISHGVMEYVLKLSPAPKLSIPDLNVTGLPSVASLLRYCHRYVCGWEDILPTILQVALCSLCNDLILRPFVPVCIGNPAASSASAIADVYSRIAISRETFVELCVTKRLHCSHGQNLKSWSDAGDGRHSTH